MTVLALASSGEGTALTFDAAERGMDAFGWNVPNAALAARMEAARARREGRGGAPGRIPADGG